MKKGFSEVRTFEIYEGFYGFLVFAGGTVRCFCAFYCNSIARVVSLFLFGVGRYLGFVKLVCFIFILGGAFEVFNLVFRMV